MEPRKISASEAENMNDEELVVLARENRDSFLYIIDRYKLKLFNYIRRITNVDPEDAEDLLQDVFIKIYLNINDFDETQKFSSWVYAITRNQVISNHRKLKARPEGYAVELNEIISNQLLSDLESDKEFDKQLLKEEMAKAIAKLDSKYKDLLILKYWEDKNYQEISDIIKKPLGTVASALNKAKKELKKVLTENPK